MQRAPPSDYLFWIKVGIDDLKDIIYISTKLMVLPFVRNSAIPTKYGIVDEIDL